MNHNELIPSFFLYLWQLNRNNEWYLLMYICKNTFFLIYNLASTRKNWKPLKEPFVGACRRQIMSASYYPLIILIHKVPMAFTVQKFCIHTQQRQWLTLPCMYALTIIVRRSTIAARNVEQLQRICSNDFSQRKCINGEKNCSLSSIKWQQMTEHSIKRLNDSAWQPRVPVTFFFSWEKWHFSRWWPAFTTVHFRCILSIRLLKQYTIFGFSFRRLGRFHTSNSTFRSQTLASR